MFEQERASVHEVKNMHRKANRRIRKFNKSLENDELWRGRFVVREKQFNAWMYDDGSGYYARFIYRVYDKQTGYYMDGIFDEYQVIKSSKLFWWVNDFIVKYAKVWEENPRPDRATAQNWVDKPIREVKDLSWWKK